MPPIADIIAQDPVGMEQLRAVRRLDLPDWCIAAGFVRNRVWDHLHGIAPPRPPVDIDVLYFDASDVSKETRAGLRARLQTLLPGRRGRCATRRACTSGRTCRRIASTADAMTYWLETVTAVGVRLEPDDTLTVVAPLGTDDLLGLRCRPTAFGRTRRDEYEARRSRHASRRRRDRWTIASPRAASCWASYGFARSSTFRRASAQPSMPVTVAGRRCIRPPGCAPIPITHACS